MSIFVTKEVNTAGIYLVKLYINGVEMPVIVDDYFPVNKSGKPLFCSTKDSELWAMILEKAWAKLHGSYARTEGGLPCFAMNHISGVPSQSINHKDIPDINEFYNTLKSADKRNFTMIASSQGAGESVTDSGIVQGHAYSLISIHEFTHSDRSVRLLKLRNPWGRGEWTGDWSDKSNLWTPELR